MVELLEAIALMQPLPLHTCCLDRRSLTTCYLLSTTHYICDVMPGGGLCVSG
jgi:hypothetical protein